MNKSKERAREIIETHLKNIHCYGEGSVKSIILVGSLSDDSYTGNAGSDIDLIHILKENAPAINRAKIINLIDKTEQSTNKDIPISRCVYHYEDMFRPYDTDFDLCSENKDYIELPIEVLRIKDTGLVIYGEDIIEAIDNPTRDDVIKFINISKAWEKLTAKQNPEFYFEYYKMIESPTIRILSQMIITNAMLHYYFATGKSCSSKQKISIKMKDNVPNYKFQRLLDLCVKWRYSPKDITQDEEEYMMLQYKEWKIIKDNNSFDYVPLI